MKLKEDLAGPQSAALFDAFREARGKPLVVDASAVRKVDTPGLEICLSAARTWRSDGKALRYENIPDVLDSAIQTIGLTSDDFQAEGD
ncbi:hypothetical protein CSC94_17735 [Zhengella mangrovi]|uniref:STAS domain-containing protein n=1 Tax=Zhengella mangrovi TaxID=1982044 RepID=A0A2G1QJR7_9HYPH|nr:STAS domain-containing protein [Zhengella mangrovi]PHP65690.1 hypothetical protein CSC94_17735 [Zhengella mangrovi]